jgi:septal ring factor EnvC (AmiA/AmiB activator)
MELMELFTKAIAPQVLARIFDTMPQFVIIASFAGLFMYKQLMKWNKARVENIKAKEERSEAIFKNTENLVNKIDTIEKSQKETAKEIKILRTEHNALDKRVIVIETEIKINSKQENAIIGTLNYIKNSIDTNKNK